MEPLLQFTIRSQPRGRYQVWWVDTPRRRLLLVADLRRKMARETLGEDTRFLTDYFPFFRSTNMMSALSDLPKDTYGMYEAHKQLVAASHDLFLWETHYPDWLSREAARFLGPQYWKRFPPIQKWFDTPLDLVAPERSKPRKVDVDVESLTHILPVKRLPIRIHGGTILRIQKALKEDWEGGDEDYLLPDCGVTVWVQQDEFEVSLYELRQKVRSQTKG